MRQVAAAFLVAFLVACTTTPADVIQSAETLEQRAGALYGVWVIAQETAADIVVLPETPDSVVFAIANAEAAAKPVVDKMRTAYLTYQAERDRVQVLIDSGQSVGATTLQQLQSLLTALQQAVSEAEPEVNSFKSTVNTS